MSSTKKEKDLENPSIHSKYKISSLKRFFHIDRELFRFKLHFFLYSGALGASLPYLPIFAKDRIGLSATSLAVIFTVRQFSYLLAKPLICYAADYFNRLKTIICCLILIQGTFYLLFFTVPRMDQLPVMTNNYVSVETPLKNLNLSKLYEICKEENNGIELPEAFEYMECSFSLTINPEPSADCSHLLIHHLTNNATYIKMRKNNVAMSYSSQISPNAITNATACDICRIDDESYVAHCFINATSTDGTVATSTSSNEFLQYQFWLFAVLCLIASISINTQFTLSDTACCETIAKTGADFGRLKLWSPVAWGITAPVAGFLKDYTGDYLAAWVLMSLFLVLTLLNIYDLDLVKPHYSQNILKDVRTVLKSTEFLLFQFSVFLNGIGVGIIWFYLLWFLATIGGTRFLCGMAEAVQCFTGDIPFLFFSGWVIKKTGHFNVLTMGLASDCVRFFCYSRLQNPWLVLPIEFLHGFKFGLFHPAVVSYAKESAKPGTEATTQALLGATHEGLGAGIGCVLAGLGMDHLGGHRTFFWASVFAAVGTVISLLSGFYLQIHKRSMKVSTTEGT